MSFRNQPMNDCNPVQKPAIEMAVLGLEENICQLEKNIDVLRNKIGSVLTPEVQATENDKGVPEPPISSMAAALKQLAYRISRVNDNFLDIERRVEL